jgi:hypothetical protein
MLLFKKLLNNSLKYLPLPGEIICERHPLIDTLIYAKFYVDRVREGMNRQADDFDYDKFQKEIVYISNLLPKEYRSEKPSVDYLAKFIVQWFFIEKRSDFDDLGKLFGVGMPDKVYFLKASPEILFERIKGRAVKEAHESLDILTKLDDSYKRLFDERNKTCPGLVKENDSNDLGNLDCFYEIMVEDG